MSIMITKTVQYAYSAFYMSKSADRKIDNKANINS